MCFNLYLLCIRITFMHAHDVHVLHEKACDVNDLLLIKVISSKDFYISKKNYTSSVQVQSNIYFLQ